MDAVRVLKFRARDIAVSRGYPSPVLAALLALGLLGAPASGEPVGFSWHAPSECPAQDEVDVRLGLFVPRRRVWLEARAVVEHRQDGFELLLRMRAGEVSSDRRLFSRDCVTLLDAAVFSYFAALEGVDSTFGLPSSNPPEAPEVPSVQRPVPAKQPPLMEAPVMDVAQSPVETASEPAKVPTAPRIEEEPAAADPGEAGRGERGPEPARDLSRQRRRELGWLLRAHGGVGLGPLGSPSVPLGASLGLTGPKWRAELGGVAFVPRAISGSNGDGRGAQLGAWSLRGRGCGVLALSGRVELPLCAELAGGLVRAQGTGVEQSLTPSSPHLSAGGAGLVGVRLNSRLRLLAELSGALALVRPAFHVDGQEPLFRAPRVQAGGEIALEVRFGGNSREKTAQIDQSGSSRRLGS